MSHLYDQARAFMTSAVQFMTGAAQGVGEILTGASDSEFSQTVVLSLNAAGAAVEYDVEPGVLYTVRVLGTHTTAALCRVGADPAFTSTDSPGFVVQGGVPRAFQVYQGPGTLHLQAAAGTLTVYITRNSLE
jgi:hypothetical protein